MIAEEVLKRLISAAKTSAANAYCPYSKFRVGAAVLGDSGMVYPGCNIENASFGLTICAERAALCRAVTDGETRITAVVVYTPTESPTAPCGACRQALNEFGPDMDCICVSDGTEIIRMKLSGLLPAAFGPRNLA